MSHKYKEVLPMQEKALVYPEHWLRRKQAQEKISILSAYDASSARLLAKSSIDAVLVGDSLGMTVQGHSSTLDVSLEEMIYHCSLVRRGAPKLFIIGDMPFASYQASTEDAIRNAMRLVKEGKVDAVKFEGAQPELLQAIESLSQYGIPVMGHIGFTPQSYRNYAGYKVQGREKQAAEKIFQDALLLEAKGVFAIVLELIISALAEDIDAKLQIPTIGIGAGPHTTGQVLVYHDLLGLTPGFCPKHARPYARLGEQIIAAMDAYDQDVKKGSFPGKEHSFF